MCPQTSLGTVVLTALLVLRCRGRSSLLACLARGRAAACWMGLKGCLFGQGCCSTALHASQFAFCTLNLLGGGLCHPGVGSGAVRGSDTSGLQGLGAAICLLTSQCRLAG